MSKYKIEEILSNIQFQVYSDMNFIEPLGLDKETWKELLEYINKYKTTIDKIKERVDKVDFLMGDFPELELAGDIKRILEKIEQ